MKKLVILIFLISFALIGYLVFRDQHSCKKILKNLEGKFDKLDLSCNQDSDCLEGLGLSDCQCKSARTDTSNYIKIEHLGFDKGCLPQIQCMPYTCKCKSSRCISEVIP